MELSTPDTVMLAICVYHEAQGEPLEGKIAVANVILTRARQRKQTIEHVIYAPKQFSWANGGKRPPIRDYQALTECFEAVDMACRGEGLQGANHYFADYIEPPKWAKDMKFLSKIGKHLFYTDREE